MKRTLSLKRETLAPLSDNDLAGVAGAAAAVPTTPVQQCLSISFEFTCLDCVTRRSCG
jgi:pyruvate/2-oxoglutarate/acetoin dehydrogenase E1 component